MLCPQFNSKQNRTRKNRTRKDKAGQEKTRQDKTRQGRTRKEKKRKEKTRQDKTGQDKTRQDRTGQDTMSININARHSAMHMDLLLENEKIKNKTESWNKLEKSDKMHKLHQFAHEWSKKHNLSTDALYAFLLHCLEKNKLKNKKDIVYNKEIMEIKSIPSLVYENNTFKLLTDAKRISTLKCLTPKREIT